MNHQWKASREDMQSFTAEGEPVAFLYPPDGGDRIPILGPNCKTVAMRLIAELNRERPAKDVEIKDWLVGHFHSIQLLLDEPLKRLLETHKVYAGGDLDQIKYALNRIQGKIRDSL